MPACETNTIKIIKGEDKSITIALKENRLPKNITGSTVSAQIESRDHASPTANGDAVAPGSGDTGADFSAGIIVATWTDTQTAAMSTGQYQMKITVTDSGGLKTKYIVKESIWIVG